MASIAKKFWSDKKVLITGGNGFLGSHLVEYLKKQGLPVENLTVPNSKQNDLRKQSVAKKLTKNIDIVIHLAANVGGIGYNREKPGELFYDNVLLGIHMIEESRKNQVKKFVSIGTVCAYPKFTPIPFREEDLWNGYPEETNAPYGIAKKMLLVQGQSYRQQYGFNVIYLLPVNLYGPRDKFDPGQSHVIPALIKKFYDAKVNNEKEVVVWGTGNATREFLFVEDAVRAIALAAQKYEKGDPVNLGASFEISIKKLADLISRLVGYKGKIVFDPTKPDGQPRRKLDTSRAEKEFGFKSKINFEEGLKKTIKWYEKEFRKKS